MSDTQKTHWKTVIANKRAAEGKRVNFQGIPLIIERPKGSIRSGVNKKTGEKWETEMQADYGCVANGAKSTDEEDLDVYVGENYEAPYAYVIEQLKDDGSTDEYKVMLGFDSLESARETYLAHFKNLPDWLENNVGTIEEFPVSDLKASVENHAE